MSVYVDALDYWGTPKLWCHMIADSREELDAMALQIGAEAAWLQHAGEPDEHYDLQRRLRKLAIGAGAIEVSSRELVRVIREKRQARQSAEAT